MQTRHWAPIVLANYSRKKWDELVGACRGRGAATGSRKRQEKERVSDEPIWDLYGPLRGLPCDTQPQLLPLLHSTI